MSAPLETNDKFGKDPNLFAMNAEELTVIGSNEKQLEEYSYKVYSQPPPQSELPLGIYEPEILHKIKATIFEVGTESVRIKMGEDVYVNIPKVVFSGKESTLKYGQAIFYSIKRRKNGFRFQDIDIDNDAGENPHKKNVLDILNAIPQRQ